MNLFLMKDSFFMREMERKDGFIGKLLVGWSEGEPGYKILIQISIVLVFASIIIFLSSPGMTKTLGILPLMLGLGGIWYSAMSMQQKYLPSSEITTT